jgi:lipid-binding SYLF domain-containing protein
VNKTVSICVGLLVLVAAGCSTAPKTKGQRENLQTEAQATLKHMFELDPSLSDFLGKGHAYAVFPSVGKGGLIVGGSYGRGVVYERGKMIGYADITSASVGLQAGGQTFSEVLAFETKAVLDDFRNNRLKLAANASAVVLKTGTAGAAQFQNGVAVFVQPEKGLMAELAVGGQAFSFVPVESAEP